MGHRAILSRIFLVFFIAMSVCAGTLSKSVSAQQIIQEQVVHPNEPKALLFLSPASGSFLVGSTFEESIFVDTEGSSINAVEAHLKFPADKLEIVKPSSGKSIFSIWIAPPNFSNTAGTADFTGVILNGITTKSGLVTSVTFRVIASGNATVKLLTTSKVLMNDGFGSAASEELQQANYDLLPIPPAGVTVFSPTHPLQDRWYNNNNPVMSWEKDSGVTDFSYTFDTEPSTVPDNTSDATGTTVAYENVGDGLDYFHIKARKDGIWGSPTHFLVRIDTTPPAEFHPTVEFLTAAIVNRTLVSFFTTDALSGIDHYEVGAIDKTQAATNAPAFTETESPYQLSADHAGNLRVIVRAFDNAGNVREEYLDVTVPTSLTILARNNWLLYLLILILIYLLLSHYVFKHRIFTHIGHVLKFIKKEESESEEDEAKKVPLPPPKLG